MKKIIKNNIKTFIIILITTIVVGSVSVYAASQYFAKDISFTPSNENFKKENGEPINNVEDALNALYGKKGNIYIKNDEVRKVLSRTTVEESLDEILTSEYWMNKITQDTNSIKYLIDNNYTQYLVDSKSGMSNIAKSKEMTKVLLTQHYNEFINSSYLSDFDKNAIQVPTMTSYTEPKGVVSASTENIAAYLAFDKKSDNSSVRSAWTATKYNNGYIQYMFDEPNRIYKFTLENLADGSINYVTNFSLEASNDGVNFTNLYTGNNGSGNVTKRTFLLTSLQEQYKYYRIVINNKGGNWAGFGEINFYCVDID